MLPDGDDDDEEEEADVEESFVYMNTTLAIAKPNTSAFPADESMSKNEAMSRVLVCTTEGLLLVLLLW